jgi:hypothetical protein
MTAEDREKRANEYVSKHGDAQTRVDFLAGWDAAMRAGVVAEEPEWETEEIEYGHLLKGGIFIVEHRGKNYSTHQRRIKLGRPESSWVVDESAAPWARRDGCFAHCDPEGWFSPCRVPVKQEEAEGAHEGHKIVEIPTFASSLIGRRCTTCNVELEPREDTDD